MFQEIVLLTVSIIIYTLILQNKIYLSNFGFFFFFRLSGSALIWVKNMNVKKAPNPILIKPMKVIIIFMLGGVIADNPISVSIIPVT